MAITKEESEFYISVMDRLSPFFISMEKKLEIAATAMERIRPILQKIHRIEMKRIHTQYRQKKRGRW